MSNGRFNHGGQHIPETLMNAVIELEEAYNHYKDDPEFNRELAELLNEYAGRPSRLYYAAHMTEDLGGAKVYLKREDLNHTESSARSTTSSGVLAKKWAKPVSSRKTGAGQHGVATATAAAPRNGMRGIHGKRRYRAPGTNGDKMRLWRSSCNPPELPLLKDAVFETMRMDQPYSRYPLVHWPSRVLTLSPKPPLSAISRQLSPKKSKNRCWKITAWKSRTMVGKGEDP